MAAQFKRSKKQKSMQSGQSLIETALLLPLLLTLVFNAINFGHFYYIVLNLNTAPRQAAQFATQGGKVMSVPDAGPPTDSGTIAGIAYENLTNTLKDATGAPIQVCAASVGVVNPQETSQRADCQAWGTADAFPATANVDPEAPVFILHRVDVAYNVTPVIPGAVFNVIVPSNLTFHRYVCMRSLY